MRIGFVAPGCAAPLARHALQYAESRHRFLHGLLPARIDAAPDAWLVAWPVGPAGAARLRLPRRALAGRPAALVLVADGAARVAGERARLRARLARANARILPRCVYARAGEPDAAARRRLERAVDALVLAAEEAAVAAAPTPALA